MQLNDRELNIIKTFFTGKPVIKAYLFGSYARGEADKNSDLDILVELDYSQHIGLGFVAMQIELIEKLKKKVDLVSANGLSKYVIPFIEQDKKLIYER